MYKINNEIMQNVEVYLEFADSNMRMPNGEKLKKYSPRIYVEGINKNNENMSIMIETFISDEELRSLKINEELDLKYLPFNQDKDLEENITDIILFTNRNFETAKWPDQEKEVKITIKKMAENLINIKAYIEEFNLEYDIETTIQKDY